jgi:hypothetical protein
MILGYQIPRRLSRKNFRQPARSRQRQARPGHGAHLENSVMAPQDVRLRVEIARLSERGHTALLNISFSLTH